MVKMKHHLLKLVYLLWYFLKEIVVTFKNGFSDVFDFLKRRMWEHRILAWMIFWVFFWALFVRKDIKLSLYLFAAMLFIVFLKVKKAGHYRKPYKEKFVYKK